jgi:hypothetical protein
MYFLQLLKREKIKKKFLLKINKAQIFDGRFVLTDENRENPKDLDFTKLNASLTDFQIYGPEVT